MNKYIKLSILILFIFSRDVFSQQAVVSSPDEQLQVTVSLKEGKLFYTLTYADHTVLEESRLGFITNLIDYSESLSWEGSEINPLNFTYEQEKIKQAKVHYQGNELTCMLSNRDERPLRLVFRVSNHDVAFRYEVPETKSPLALVVKEELTGFNFIENARSYLTPQSKPMVGWERTKPSYEERYEIDKAITTKSSTGMGFTFPGLFKSGEEWVLISETGVSALYCSSHLSDPDDEGNYQIAFPNEEENNGFGSTGAAIGLPAATPWRTITVGNSLKPIIETTVPYDVVEPLYEPSQKYEYGKGTWSWIMWQDNSMNYEDQKTYIDLASTLGYEFILIDALWDKNIGYHRMEELIQYASSKKVGVFLWYNSNGAWNDAPQSPRNKMNTAIARKKEMKWMQEHGVKGIKVDFFGGDKQETMRLYENILSDANDYGLMLVFHGTTLPRGWERMYPNFVGSEAILASENLMFSQGFNDIEALNATLYPFIRNTVASMEFGGVVLNKRYNRTNDGGNHRRTTDAFQLAIAVLYQNPVQFFALTPNNLEDAPDFAIDFMKEVPTTWEETRFIDGYPGKYCVLARKSGGRWYIAGVNAQKKSIDLKLSLPMLSGKSVQLYGDSQDGQSFSKNAKINKNGIIKITIQPNGGVVIKE
ncbi:glycoside hydrolase family 97 protein [Fulvivirga sediminis]|uniref:Glycoside hydrolase family 97 protein n=1 Tax=Fulvivirga sediminis TaxID=2803949 RepID=A0A937F8M9_9BACT|nr:glycoside hydrolase family 97 protein [Fulvivirga sediminis]MBL3657196.1 glycoside hydrolase family 97 protein [Fulvivirga sediminis]